MENCRQIALALEEETFAQETADFRKQYLILMICLLRLSLKNINTTIILWLFWGIVFPF